MSSKLLFGNCAELRTEKVDPKLCPESYYIGLEHIEQKTLSLVGHGYGADVDSQKQRFYKGDILFGKLRPYFRKVVIAPFDGICSTDIWVVKPKVGVDRNFLFYWMASEEFIASSMYASEGGRMPRAKWDWVCKFELENLTPDEQTAIGKALRVLDLKIEANMALSKTLEDIAQTIFKSWFIDFDPVREKMAGRKPADMDAATAALFPDSLEESELGLIPAGWEVLPSTDLFELLSGGTPKTSNENYWNGNIPWFSVVDAPDSGGCFFVKTNKTITKDGLDNSAAKLVRPGVTVISARGTVGKTAIVAIPSTFNQSCYGIEGKYGDFFTYLLLRNQIIRLQSISHGGMFDTITRETFSAIKVAKPEAALISVFESFVSPIFLEIRNLQFQCKDLASIRDSLLPRLISGELKIPEDKLAS
jgi:type I restriction enzyme, S subunit